MKKVAVVVLNWNGWKDTVECIKSLQKCDTSGFEVKYIVVDNASTNDSVSKIKALKAKNMDLVVNNKNLGFAGGNNVGVRKAIKEEFDYIMILNNDTVLDKKTISSLFDFFEENKNVGAASPKIYFAEGFEFHKDRYKKDSLGKVIWYAGGAIDWNNVYGSNFGVDEVDKGQFSVNKETDFATGACMFLRVSVLQEVGLFDEKYFLYLEDADLSLRIKKAGYRVCFIPSSLLWHKVSQSSGIGSNLNDYFITRNRLFFGMRYASVRARFALLREAMKMLIAGRTWQKIGVKDYFSGKLGVGSWK